MAIPARRSSRTADARYDGSWRGTLCHPDADGMVSSACQFRCPQFGYTPQELIGKRSTLLFETQDAWHDTWRAVMAGEKFSQRVELVARRKDGGLSYFEVSASRWQNDTRVFVTAILRDVNERRAAEAALRASERQFRETAEALSDLNATLAPCIERTQAWMAEEALRQSHKREPSGN